LRLVSGAGELFDPDIKTLVHPLMGSSHPDILAVKRELDGGIISEAFDSLVARLAGILRDTLADCDVCIAHNVLTLHKNLPLTAALRHLIRQNTNFRLVAWCHDLAWTNTQYQPELHDGYPWDLLCQPWPQTHYVTVSEPRRVELAELLGISPDSITVITPGINPAAFFHWTPDMLRLVERFNLLDADGLLLLPARLTRRKNIALALHVLAALRRQSGRDFRLIVTGPPGPHNPTNMGYLGELLDLRQELNLADSVHFLYALDESPNTPFLPTDDTMANLYQLADALFFPSSQEGFGIPILEAGLAGLPIFCADIPPLRATAGDDAVYFDPTHTDPEQIAKQVLDTLNASAPYRLRLRVRRQYRWQTIIQNQLVPLLEGM
jgi:glycosyltransferase involved in cell wall biosynthesis